jgi:chromosome segregation ATPase
MAGDSAAPLPHAGFEVARKGYDQSQVEAHLRRLDAEMRILATDRDAAVDQSSQLTRELDDSRARAERLRAQVRTLVSPQQSVQGMSERMRSMLRMAEDEVAEMLARAETEVKQRLHDAEQRAATIVQEARAAADAMQIQIKSDAEAAEQRDALRRAELEAQARDHYERLATTTKAAEREIAEARARLDADRQEHSAAAAAADATAERRRADVWAESESRRAQVEADFRIAMDQRRKEALSALIVEQLSTRTATEELQKRADEQARQTVDAARVQAGHIVADAEVAVVRLRAQRQRMIAQLRGCRGDLDALVASLAPVPGEEEALQDAAAAAHGDGPRAVAGATAHSTDTENSAGTDAPQTRTTADSDDTDTPPIGAATTESGSAGNRSAMTVAEHVAEVSASGGPGAAESSSPNRGATEGDSVPNGDPADAERPRPRPRTGAGAAR